MQEECLCSLHAQSAGVIAHRLRLPLSGASALAPQARGVIQSASRAALRELMHGKALVQWVEGQQGQLELTNKGRAAYDSALPLDAAMRLYDSCARAEDGGSVLGGGTCKASATLGLGIPYLVPAYPQGRPPLRLPPLMVLQASCWTARWSCCTTACWPTLSPSSRGQSGGARSRAWTPATSE